MEEIVTKRVNKTKCLKFWWPGVNHTAICNPMYNNKLEDWNQIFKKKARLFSIPVNLAKLGTGLSTKKSVIMSVSPKCSPARVEVYRRLFHGGYKQLSPSDFHKTISATALSQSYENSRRRVLVSRYVTRIRDKATHPRRTLQEITLFDKKNR